MSSRATVAWNRLAVLVAVILGAGLVGVASAPIASAAVFPTPVVAVATGPGGQFWTAAADGSVNSLGGASFYGSMAGQRLNRLLVGMSATSTGHGYWLVASDGGLFSFGDARFFGSTGSMTLARPIVGMAATPTGAGYWLVASDGGIFAFGDARFFGSTGAMKLARPIVGMAATPTGAGYWLVASDGGIFAFGDARFFGSTGDLSLNQPVVGMTASIGGVGYRLVAADGGLFSFGAATFYGALGGEKLNSPVVGSAPTADGGYVLVQQNGTVTNFGPGGSGPGSSNPTGPVTTDGSARLSAGAVRPGGKVSLSASGFRPASSVRIELHSEPVLLAQPEAGTDGAVSSELTIPASTPEGSHHVVATGVDPAGQPVTKTLPLIVDFDGPEVVSIDVTPASAGPGEQAVVSVHVRDASGVGSFGVTTRTPASSLMNWCSGEATRVSGTAQDGVWSRSCTVPPVVSPGSYAVTAYGSDVLGNWQGSSTPSATFVVTGDGPVDTDGFLVVSIEASPSSARPGDVVTISVHATDATGVSTLGVATRTPAGSLMNWCSGEATLVSGTAQDGVWSRSCTVPPVVSPGSYAVTAYGSDVLGNWQGSSTPSATFVVTGDGPVDTDGFLVVSIEASPLSARPGDVVTISVHTTDASGVSTLGVATRTPASSLMSWCSGEATLVSGTVQDGTWVYQCTVPEVVSSGTYTVTAYGSDVLSNWQGSSTPAATFTITE